MRLSQKMEGSRVISFMRNVLMSDWFMYAQLIIAAVFIVLQKDKDYTMIAYGDLVLAIIISLILIICDDFMTILLPFMLISCMSIKCYDSFNVFIKYIYFAPVLAFALIFHFVVYRRKFEWGKTWPGAVAVTLAVTLGGVGIISAPEYFSPTALFYTITLGIGMLLAYFLINTYVQPSEKYRFRYRFSFIMTLVGLFCVFMVLHHYSIHFARFLEKLSPLDFQWRNNLSTLLLLTIPFTFFLSSTKYYFLFLGFLQYGAILLTSSRGGFLCGTIETMLCLIVLIYCDARNRKKTLIIIASVVFVMLTFFLRFIFEYFEPVLQRIAEGDEIREQLIARAIEDFKSNIVFGRGLGYNGNTDVHAAPKFAITWYHSAPFQIIGSFGLFGVAAYLFQFYNRMKVIFKKITQFNLTLFVAYAGLFLMSLVNPGEFCPFPYGIMATAFFIICDKSNSVESVKVDNGDDSLADYDKKVKIL